MSDLTPNDLSHLSDEKFLDLCPQGCHATGTAVPLSPTTQAILDAVREISPAPAGEIVAVAFRAMAEICSYPDDHGVDWISTSEILSIVEELETA